MKNPFPKSLAVTALLLVAAIALTSAKQPPQSTALVKRNVVGSANVDSGVTASAPWFTLGGLGDDGTAADVDTFRIESASGFDWAPGGYGILSTTTYVLGVLEIESIGGVIAASCDTLFYALDWGSGARWTNASFTAIVLPTDKNWVRVPIKVDPHAANTPWLSESYRLRLRGDGNLSSYPKARVKFKKFDWNK